MRDVMDYIIDLFNSKRLHSSVGYLSPNEYKCKYNETYLCVRKNLTSAR
jgi:transposase InsO family protein